MTELQEYPQVHLQTGDCFLGVRPTLVTTVLGSCVAVTMCAPKRGIGAICHAFLPDSSVAQTCGREPQTCRFVDAAMENMLSSMRRLHIDPECLVIKVFGGATGIVRTDCVNVYDVGGRNVRAVRAWLVAHGLRAAKSQTGGNCGRKLLFLTHTGEVWVKTLGHHGGNR